jgi:ABC-2 type transport system permease protein
VIALLYTLANVMGYAQAYPTLASREQFARAFSDNIALRLFYGVPHDLTTVGGFFEFRAMGMLAILASAWALFAAIRALRGEEDAGCYELILSGVIGRGGGAVAVLAALAIECAVLFALLLVVLLVFAVAAGDMTTVQAAMVAAAIVGPAAVFAAVGALASQLARPGARPRPGRGSRSPPRSSSASSPTSAAASAGCAGSRRSGGWSRCGR